MVLFLLIKLNPYALDAALVSEVIYSEVFWQSEPLKSTGIFSLLSCLTAIIRLYDDMLFIFSI